MKKLFFCLITITILLTPLISEAAVLYLMPPSQTVYRGDSFVVEVRLDTEGDEINAVETNLNFPPNLLEIIDITKGGSILTLWLEEPAYRSPTSIVFAGGVPGGFRGNGLIDKISFLAKEIGKAEVNFGEDSKVLYGQGLLAELSFLEGNYEIISKPEGLPVISSKSHPGQNKWYSQSTLRLHWDLIEGAEYSFLLSKDPTVQPDEIPERPEGELIWMGDMEYAWLEDGIYYFHLKQKLPGEDWSKKVTFRAMIDVTPPEEFKPEIGKDPTVFEGKYFLSFAATDEASGIDFYQVKEGKRDFKKVKSPYGLEDQSLKSKIVVKAVDKAGNEKIAQIIPPKEPFPYWIIILILIGAGIIWWIIKKLKKPRKNYETWPRNISETRPR